MLAAGALSYLLKNVSAEDLAEAIRAAHSGRSTLAAEAIQALVQPVQDESSLATISPRASARCWHSWSGA